MSLGLQALTIPLQARAFGVSDFAIHATALAACYVGLTFADFGLSIRALRLGAEPPGPASDLAWVRLGCCALLLCAAGLAAAVVDGPGQVIVLATAAFAAGEVSGDLAVNVWLGEKKRYLGVSAVVLRRLAALLPLVVYGGLMGAALSLFVGGFVGVASCAAVASRRRPSWRGVWGAVTGSFSFWSTSFGTNLQRFDVLIVGVLAPASLTGYFGAAVRLSNPLSSVTALLLQYSVPELATSNGTGRAKALRLLRLLVVTWAIILCLGSVFAETITVLLLGEAFRGAWPIVGAVLVGSAVSAVGQLWLAEHLADGVPKRLPTLMLGAVLVGLATLATGTSLGGTWGAAAGLLATYLGVSFVLLLTRRVGSSSG